MRFSCNSNSQHELKFEGTTQSGFRFALIIHPAVMLTSSKQISAQAAVLAICLRIASQATYPSRCVRAKMISPIDSFSRKAMRQIMFKSPMCITPLLPIAQRAEEGSRGSILIGNYSLNRLTSKWKSTNGRLTSSIWWCAVERSSRAGSGTVSFLHLIWGHSKNAPQTGVCF